MASLESTLVNSIVGAGTFFKGTIVVSGLLRVDGDFRGAIQTDGRVIIGRSGRADCTIDAATVVIGGVFRGTIYAREKVIALESAIVMGNIYSPRLIAESNVILDGALHIHVKETVESRDTTSSDVSGRADLPTSRRNKGRYRRSAGRRKTVPLLERESLEREDQR
ncbi:MAG: polymer-forming cytoskeletal protein [Alkalispirochaeta sp.]|jgi:cytoskeletal protein CcmA (bactofilin family)